MHSAPRFVNLNRCSPFGNIDNVDALSSNLGHPSGANKNGVAVKKLAPSAEGLAAYAKYCTMAARSSTVRYQGYPVVLTVVVV